MKRKQNYSGISLTNKLFNMKKDFNPSRSRASRLCPGQTYGRNFTRSEVMVKWNGGFKSATCDPNWFGF
jgi:hypothetical protein